MCTYFGPPNKILPETAAACLHVPAACLQWLSLPGERDLSRFLRRQRPTCPPCSQGRRRPRSAPSSTPQTHAWTSP